MSQKHKKKIEKAINNPKLIIIVVIANGLFYWLPDKLYLKLMYYASLGKKLDFKHPKTFNEKLQWLKLYNREPLYTKLVDKYEVRKYIAETIGEEYLIPLIGVWDKFEDINFSELPNQFVLKCNHDSGGIVICTDKDKLDIVSAEKKINRCLKRNYYYYSREWPYKNVKPRIICEKYMTNESGSELKDYKFMCFDGEVKCLLVCSDRNSPDGLKLDFYDTNWKIMPFKRRCPNSNSVIPKPINFEKMLELAKKLSYGIPFVRVDFYEIDGQVYFGELTFYPGAGYEEFIPESYDYLLGSWIKYPKSTDEFKGE